MLATFFFVLAIFLGIFLSNFVLCAENARARLFMGFAFGLFIQIWLPALFAFWLGFSADMILACAITCAACCVVGFATMLFGKKKNYVDLTPGNWKGLAVCVVFATALCAFLLFTHTLLPKADGLHTGQSTFGDMPMHLSFITNLANTGKFPPSYPLLAGNVPMGYPFLSNAISSVLLLGGYTLRWAYMVPMLEAFAVVFGMGWVLFEKVLKCPKKATLGFVLFFLGSGFGFAYFLDGTKGNPQNFTRIFNSFYETPTNLVEHNIKWVNPIADLLIPQRATLFGWAILFACLYLLYLAAFEKKRAMFLPLGILAGGLPLIQTHAFLALGILSGVYLLWDIFVTREGKQIVGWLWYALIVAALALPQLLGFTFAQASAEGFLRFGFNWANDSDPYFWFYIKNIGLTYLLLLPAFLRARPELKRLYVGALAILVLSEFIIFQPNPYDNNKLLYIWHLLGVMLVADMLCDAYQRGDKRIRGVAAVGVVFVCTFGSLLTLGREAVSDYVAFDSDHTAAASYISRYTPTDSLFLTSNNHNNAVASLSGRQIVCGSGSYLHFHGLPYTDLEKAAKDLYERPNLPALQALGVDYIYISEYERSAFAVNQDFFDLLPNPYTKGTVSIYEVPKPKQSP